MNEQQIKQVMKDYARYSRVLGVHSTMFKKLYKILGNHLLKLDFEYMRLSSDGFMDLHVDNLGGGVLAIAHNYTQEGDVMADPDMQIRVNLELGTVEALTYQQSAFSIYQEVYPSPNMVNARLKRDLNAFLNTWLGNLLSQGHKIVEVKGVQE